MNYNVSIIIIDHATFHKLTCLHFSTDKLLKETKRVLKGEIFFYLRDEVLVGTHRGCFGLSDTFLGQRDYQNKNVFLSDPDRSRLLIQEKNTLRVTRIMKYNVEVNPYRHRFLQFQDYQHHDLKVIFHDIIIAKTFTC